MSRCKTCAVRFYCSDECRQISWEKSHQWECFGERKQILTIYTRLVLNILFEASHHNFSTIVEADSRYGNKRNNYAFVNQLATNKSELTNDEIYAFTQVFTLITRNFCTCSNYSIILCNIFSVCNLYGTLFERIY